MDPSLRRTARPEGKDTVTTPPSLSIRGLTRRFGAVAAVEGFDLDVPDGAFVVLVGPSGCGKTTVLRLLAGLDTASAGTIAAGGRDLTRAAPADRGMGMVFQSYALFPNLSVADNIDFGLSRRTPAAARRARVAEMLEVVGLAGFGARRPDQLSGGQQQRVALARALAPAPGTLLLDEPLSALDPHNRERLRLELKALQRRLGVTTVMVTHDQAEALALADVIVVMRAGKIAQVGSPQDVYRRPASVFVAGFLGPINLWPASVIASGEVALNAGGGRLALDTLRRVVGDAVIVGARPEAIIIGAPTDDGLPATVETAEFRGATARLMARTPAGGEALVDVPAGEAARLVGKPVSIRIAPGEGLLFPAGEPL